MMWEKFRKKRWVGIVSNLYVLVLTIFVIWMLFLTRIPF